MKKTSLIKGILLILLSVVLIGTTGVYAADALSSGLDDDLSNFTNTNTNTNTNSNVAENNAVNNSNSLVENTNVTNNTNKVNNTNSSIYNNVNNTTNNTNLPKTGIEDSIPTMVLVVIFGISAVYAYKKIKEYNNI